MGVEIKLSIDHLFVTTVSSDQLVYEWLFNDQEIAVNDKCFKNSDTSVLRIERFECKYVGTYECIISTANQPTVSMSAKIKLDIRGEYSTLSLSLILITNLTLLFYAEPPNCFDAEMNENDFLLHLNANGIPYKVCKILRGKKTVSHGS